MRSSRAVLASAISIAALITAVAAASASPRSETATPSPPGTGSAQPCGEQTSGSGPDGTVTFTPCDPGPAPRPRPLVVEPRPGMANVTAIGFDTAKVGADDRSLAVRFWSGVEPCSVLDHIDVAYGADAVTVTLYQGSDPSAGLVACPEIAVLKQVTVVLDEPLAGRDIVDGTR
jgi:hypothetical protein